MKTIRFLVCLTGAAVVGGSVFAGDGAQTDIVPLYTNADLVQFGPPEPVPPAPSTDEIERQWAFVHDYLDREQARIQTERRLDIDRSAVEPIEPEPAYDGGYPVYTRAGWFGSYYGGYYGGVDGNLWDRGNDYRALPRYDLRTARHGYYVPRASDRRPGNHTSVRATGSRGGSKAHRGTGKSHGGGRGSHGGGKRR